MVDNKHKCGTHLGMLCSQYGSRWFVLLGCLMRIRSIFSKQTTLVRLLYLLAAVQGRKSDEGIKLGHLGVGFKQRVYKICWKGWNLAAYRQGRNGQSNRTVMNGKVRTGQGGWGRYFWTALAVPDCQPLLRHSQGGGTWCWGWGDPAVKVGARTASADRMGEQERDVGRKELGRGHGNLV